METKVVAVNEQEKRRAEMGKRDLLSPKKSLKSLIERKKGTSLDVFHQTLAQFLTSSVTKSTKKDLRT